MTRQSKKSLNGLRSIATLQTLAGGATPRERHQLANRYARLENERARLEREIGIWENCRQTAANKLAKVHEEIGALRLMLDEVPAEKPARRNGSVLRRGPAAADGPGPVPAQGRTMQLEY